MDEGKCWNCGHWKKNVHGLCGNCHRFPVYPLGGFSEHLMNEEAEEWWAEFEAEMNPLPRL